MIDELPDLGSLGLQKTINDMWLSCDGDDPTSVVLVGNDGYVYSLAFAGARMDQSVNAGQETTSLKLIKTWGVNLEKFWVMDESGTIWERTDNRWRVVVRGMYRDDVKFNSVWVSPKGTVLAVTDKHLYRLD